MMCMSIEADMNSTLFRLEDENGYFQKAIPQATKLSLSEVRFVLIEGCSCVHILFIVKLSPTKLRQTYTYTVHLPRTVFAAH